MKEYGLDKESNILSLPGAKESKILEEEKELDKSEARRYRGSVARMNYLGQDRSDIQHSVKELSKKMAQPTARDELKMKKMIRYLIGRPRYINKYKYQDKPISICVHVDSDFAGCHKSRKSTSGGIIFNGHHSIKSWSVNQPVIALSSGEPEYYSLVKGASNTIGVESIMSDLGVSYVDPILIRSDASAAIGIASRIGIGKVRHIEVSQLWVQDKIVEGLN